MASPGRRRGSTLSARFLAYFSVAYLVLIGMMGVGIMLSVQSTLVDRLFSQLETDAELARQSLPRESRAYPEWARNVSESTGARVTLINTSGDVLADSHSDPSAMENHSGRPEVVSALNGAVGEASRKSATTGYEQHYVALPPVDGLIVRLSISESAIHEEIAPIRSTVLLTAIAAALLGILIVWFVARRMARPIVELTGKTMEIAGGRRSVRPGRYSVDELDRLALAIAQLADDLGKELAETESASATLVTVLGALPQGTILVSSDNVIGYANPAAELLIGPIPEDLRRLTPFALQAVAGESRASGASVLRELDFGQPPRRLRIEAAPLAGEGAVLLIVTDVTEIELTSRVRRDFAANASHELKTPLAAILASTEALRIAIEREPGTAGRFADQVEASANQLNHLVNDLLDLSRLDREQLETTRLSLDAVLSRALEQLVDRARDSGVTVETSIRPVEILGSERDLAVALRNVLDNALRHCREGDVISVGLKTEGEYAVISVSDTGEGIPARDVDRIFERFYRVDAARSRSSGGTGLGLSIVKHAVESHGGRVEVDTELGVGSTFHIRLPLPPDNSDSASN